ncbi:MAG: CBS domain-containing protein [Planctomycetales bacterium]|nr:CBS domain-containing protein [Planctomycetales bacterium]
MSIGRICTRTVDVAAPDETTQTAAERMKSRKVGTLVVVDNQQRPIGIVTDRDLAVCVVAQGLDPRTTEIETVMSKVPESVTEDTPIESALAIMRRGCHRRLPVVDDDDQLLGLVTLDDILTLLSEEFQEIGQLLQKESPGSVGL